jgi:hypothetical protein
MRYEELHQVSELIAKDAEAKLRARKLTPQIWEPDGSFTSSVRSFGLEDVFRVEPTDTPGNQMFHAEEISAS